MSLVFISCGHGMVLIKTLVFNMDLVNNSVSHSGGKTCDCVYFDNFLGLTLSILFIVWYCQGAALEYSLHAGITQDATWLHLFSKLPLG